jgi:heme/copper-type cytochrome/quinol oxidase subunit 3
MIRVIITQLILFALPFVAFFAYKAATSGWTGARVAATGRVTFYLIMAGAALVIAGFVYFAVSGHEPTGVYVPTQYRDGELIPGGFRSE